MTTEHESILPLAELDRVVGGMRYTSADRESTNVIDVRGKPLREHPTPTRLPVPKLDQNTYRDVFGAPFPDLGRKR